MGQFAQDLLIVERPLLVADEDLVNAIGLTDGHAWRNGQPTMKNDRQALAWRRLSPPACAAAEGALGRHDGWSLEGMP